MNRNNYIDDDDDDYYRKRDRGSRDYGNGHSSRRRRSRSRSRSRDNNNYRESNEDESSSNRDRHFDRNRNRDRSDRYRDRRDYDRNDRRETSNYRSNRHYDSEGSDGGNNYSTEPNNKVIVRGLAQHITEADIQCDLIQCGLKPSSIRLIRKKSTGASRGFAFVTFSSIDDAKSWIEMKQGVLILQDQYRAILQYSFTKDNDNQWDKVQTDWYCGKCGVFNFKRRDNCFKCSASREESGSEGFDEISQILTKKIMFRNLDALTTEENVLTVLQDKIPEHVSKISRVLICRDQHTKISRGICYLNFDNLVDSMNTYQTLEKLQSLEIDGREVSFSYCVDAENRVIAKPQSSSNGSSNRRNDNIPPSASLITAETQSFQNYQYTLDDVPKLAEQATAMYAQNAAEKESYMKYYTEFYTNQIVASKSQAFEANSGASIAMSAIERKQKMKGDSYAPVTVDTPNGTDGKKYPSPDVSVMQYDESGYFFDKTTNLYFDQSSNYFYNSELGQYLYWDATNSTYVLATSDTTSIAQQPTAPTAPIISQQSGPPPPPPNDEPKEKEVKKESKDKVKVAKNIVKDMEKWAKKLNSKKDYTPIVQQPRIEAPQPIIKSDVVSDICFSMLEKKDRPVTSTLSVTHVPYHSDSDENEDQAALKSAAAANSFSENDLVDFEKLTCFLCKRAFQSVDILSKHMKQSNLHKENLQKYKLQNGILEIDPSSASNSLAAQSYRDRAKERRQKYGEADPLPPVNKAKERYQREMEKKASLVQTYQAQSLASRPISEDNKGSKLLKAMGWREGSGLGKSGQGRTEIIEAEQRVSNAGLGSKNASYGAGPGDDYKSYIKKMMKKRYEEVN